MTPFPQREYIRHTAPTPLVPISLDGVSAPVCAQMGLRPYDGHASLDRGHALQARREGRCVHTSTCAAAGGL